MKRSQGPRCWLMAVFAGMGIWGRCVSTVYVAAVLIVSSLCVSAPSLELYALLMVLTLPWSVGGLPAVMLLAMFAYEPVAVFCVIVLFAGFGLSNVTLIHGLFRGLRRRAVQRV